MSDIAVTDLHAAMEALAPLARLAAAGGLRALPAEPRDGQTSGGDPQAFVDRMHDRGDAARARVAWERLQRVPLADRRVLEWLADRGDARPSVREAAVRLAAEHAPIELRDAHDRAVASSQAAQRAHGKALRKSKRLLTDEVARLRDVCGQRTRAEQAAVEQLLRWGRGALAAAVRAWAATEKDPKAA